MRSAFWVLTATGCVAMPPPAHFVPLGPVASAPPGVGTVELAAAAGVNQVISATYVQPFAAAPALVCDVGGQGGPRGVHTTAGLTLRTGGKHVEGGHFGVRLGAIGGLGDVAGVSRLQMPFAGGEVALQAGAGFGDGIGAYAVNLGVQAMFPTTQRKYVVTTGAGSGATEAVPINGYYAYLDTRVDVPLGDNAAFIVGAGLDVGLGVYFPRGAMGVRWAPGGGARR